MNKKKPNVAFIELTCCAGCECALLNENEKFLELLNHINVVDFRLLQDNTYENKINYDIAFVLGTPMTKEQIEYIKTIRKKSKFLVAYGNCSIFGSVWASKNWKNKNEVMKKVYTKPKGIDNFEIKGIKDFIEVDYEIHACPINANEFIRITYDLLAGRKPFVPERPVCYECQLNGYECVLQQGKPCFGPVTLGGCDAVCLKNKKECQACRGPLKDSNFSSLWKIIVKMVGEKRATQILEIFGVKDEFFKTFKHK